MNKPIFIAEVKSKSPYGFESRYTNQQLLEIAIEYGSWISIHTDPRFGGSFDDIYFARQQTKKPILAKGFHTHDDDVKKAIDLGADYVLIVDRFPRQLFYNWPGAEKLIFEISNEERLNKLSYDALDFGKILYNGRDLKTGIRRKDIGNYAKYREKCSWLCGASLLKSPDDVQKFYPNCDAFIVGTYLEEFCREIKYRQLVEEENKLK